MFAIRFYNTAPRDKYDQLRRGFLTQTDKDYSFFYTDNFHAAYYCKMAIDSYVPTVDELIQVYNLRQFPARFGRSTQQEREMAALNIAGRDPGIQNAGYKIAHIIDVGRYYYINDRYFSLKDIVEKYFPRGKREDWILKYDGFEDYHLRQFHVNPEARKYLVATFLRFVHPFNYFLTPKRDCILPTPNYKDIAEYSPLINFVCNKFFELYEDAYDEFLSLIMIDQNNLNSNKISGNNIINLKYSLNINDNIVLNTRNDAIIKNTRNNTNLANISIQVTEDLKLKMLKEYLTNPKTSFRKLEIELMKISAPPRGGGFQAMTIINSFGASGEHKGILANNSIDELIDSDNTNDKLKDSLQKYRDYLY